MSSKFRFLFLRLGIFLLTFSAFSFLSCSLSKRVASRPSDGTEEIPRWIKDSGEFVHIRNGDGTMTITATEAAFDGDGPAFAKAAVVNLNQLISVENSSSNTVNVSGSQVGNSKQFDGALSLTVPDETNGILLITISGSDLASDDIFMTHANSSKPTVVIKNLGTTEGFRTSERVFEIPFPNNGITNDWISMANNEILLHFDETLSPDSTSLIQSSGNAFTATYGDPGEENASRQGIVGRSLHVDGMDAIVDLSPQADASEGSLAIWIYPDTLGGQRVVFTTDKQSDTDKFELSLDGSNVVVRVDDGENEDSYTFSQSITVNTWTHLVVTWDSSRHVTGYLNGVKHLDSIVARWPASMPMPALAIDNNDSGLSGRIDEFALWSRELTPLEALSIYPHQSP